MGVAHVAEAEVVRTNPAEGLRTCTKCGDTKPTTEFYFDRSRGGHRRDCRSCKSKYMKAYWSSKKGLRRRYSISQYGITPEDYERMLAEQGGVCAICGDPPSDERRLCVDHDHDTDKVRALLCIGCNAGLGSLKEDPDLLVAAAMYIVKHKEGYLQ